MDPLILIVVFCHASILSGCRARFKSLHRLMRGEAARVLACEGESTTMVGRINDPNRSQTP